MKPAWEHDNVKLWLGDCLAVLPTLEAGSVDAIVTDPPAGISFMGKSWDSDKGGREQWIAWFTGIMAECLRVLKPGGHAFVWALPRTSHWTATAIEDAGFELRDCVYHIFGSGFPKSLDVSKAIDKAAGAKREAGKAKVYAGGHVQNHSGIASGGSYGGYEHTGPTLSTDPATDAARQWQGWGTALKPTVECWWLARKPLSEKTVAANVLKWGTGGLNIDACRVPCEGRDTTSRPNVNGKRYEEGDHIYGRGLGYGVPMLNAAGRFPSQLVHDGSDEVLEAFAVAGEGHRRGNRKPETQGSTDGQHVYGKYGRRTVDALDYADSGSAARFFYCAKASRRERNAGLEGMPERMPDNAVDRASKRNSEEPSSGRGSLSKPRANYHPCCKPMALMEYLVRLITPPGGTVLDHFLGSGTTGIAAVKQGFGFIGIEREAEYMEIARRRIKAEFCNTPLFKD